MVRERLRAVPLQFRLRRRDRRRPQIDAEVEQPLGAGVRFDQRRLSDCCHSRLNGKSET